MIEFISLLWTFVIPLLALLVWWYGSVPKNLPPGPLGLPVLGCMHKIKPSTAHFTLTDWSKEYGPLFSFYQGHQLVVVLADYDVMQDALLRQGDIFSGKPSFMGLKGRPPKMGILPAEGARWKEQRRFALSTLRDFGFGRPILEPKVAMEAQDLLTAIENTNGKSFDCQAMLSTAVSNVISSMIFGHRFDTDSKLKYYLDEINYRISQSQINNLSPIGIYPWLKYFLVPFSAKMQRFVGGGEDLLGFMQAEIDLARKSYDPKQSTQEPDCFVHAFDKARVEEQGQYYDDLQLLATINDLFLAGSDTTQTTLRWSLFYMATYPEIQNKVYQEIVESFGQDENPSFADRVKLPYTDATIMEVQRLANMLPLSLVHTTTENAVVSGYNIPKGAWIVPLLWAVHHNPKYFPNPEKFDPERFLDEKKNVKRNSNLIPFSTGKRICLGESLARMELFLFFTSLMQKFEFYFPSDDYSVDEPFVGFLRSPAKFMICARKRQA